MKIIASNKTAYFNYFISDCFEAGIVLTGSEIKSARAGNVNLTDSFIKFEGRNATLKNAHIAVYDKANSLNHNERADRRLLLNKSEIAKLKAKVEEKGFSVVPTKMYFKGHLVKLEIGIGKGKHTYDKRAVLKEKDIKKETDKTLKRYK